MARKRRARRDRYGAWLQHLRKDRKLTQQELATRASVPQTTLAYWEKTGELTGRKVILRLASALRVSAAKLLRADKVQWAATRFLSRAAMPSKSKISDAASSWAAALGMP